MFGLGLCHQLVVLAIFINAELFVSDMGIFSFLKQVFSDKTTPQVEIIVPFSAVDDWIESNTKTILKESREKASEAYNQILQKKSEILEYIEVLKNAQLANPNIDARMKQFMTGNRENYIQQISLFLNNLPQLTDDFYLKFQNSLQELAAKTEKSYRILQEFFADESKRIAFVLRDMDELSKRIKSIKTSGSMQNVSQIKSKIKELNNLFKLKDDMMTKIESYDESIQQDKVKIENMQIIANEKKNSPEFKSFNELIARRDALSAKMKFLDSEVSELFSPVKRSLMKFRRINILKEHEAIIDNYYGAPLIGLVDDVNLEILHILQDIVKKTQILNLGQDEETKVIERAAHITKEMLEEYRKQYRDIKSQLVEIKDNIQQNPILEEVEKIQNDIASLSSTVQRMEHELEEEESKIAGLAIESKITELQNFVNSSLGSNISIK
jgi:hypothetical protein